MKKFLSVAFIFVLSMPAMAQVLPVNIPTYSGQNRVSAGAFKDDSLLGCTPFRVEKTTAPQLITNGPGFVERLCAYGGDSGNINDFGFAAAMDDSTSASDTIVTGIPLGKIIAQPIQSLNLSRTLVSNNTPNCVSIAQAPAQFTNGLVVALSSNSITAVGCYRLEAGNNPGP